MNRVICSGVFSFSSVSFTLIHWPCFESSLDWKKALQWFVLKSSCSVWYNFKSRFCCSITMADITRWTVAVWHGCSTYSYGSNFSVEAACLVWCSIQFKTMLRLITFSDFIYKIFFGVADCNNSLPCIYSLMSVCQSISNLICEWHCLVHNLPDI